MSNRYYTGVGSRATPAVICALMKRAATRLAMAEWILRSGHAEGADLAFERGSGGECHIFLPWRSFNVEHVIQGDVYGDPTEQAMEIAAKLHPAWAHLRHPARLLHARNVHQVLGLKCDNPSEFVVCWTPDGATTETTAATGGTGMAIRVANAYDVRVLNLQNDADLREFSTIYRA
jgi:hypothetical protein